MESYTCLIASALRTALACTVVGMATLYGPSSVQAQLPFPAFSYVTIILIMSINTTLGDTIRACWLASYATLQTVCPAILIFWTVGPARFSIHTTALAGAMAALVVVVPKSTHLVAKRIALGQIVIIYVVGFTKAEQIVGSDRHNHKAVFHPLHVAANTGIGVLACVFSLLVPYPRLASSQVKKECKELTQNAAERMNLFIKAMCADDNSLSIASISQAKSLSSLATNHHQSLKRYQESMEWERLPLIPVEHCCSDQFMINPKARILQHLEQPLKGMELALTNIPSFPVEIRNHDGELKQILLLITKSLETNSDIQESDTKKSLQITSMPTTHQNLPPFFFIFCLNLLENRLTSSRMSDDQNSLMGEVKPNGFLTMKLIKISRRRLIPPLKFSLSLGLAIFLGLIYSKQNGLWSGLPVAISYVSAREATFKIANLKAQGTVLGTIYGVLICFLFDNCPIVVRFLPLLPWLVFTTFLQRSKMYGQAGGISAVIGALLILGRKNYGPPSEFAIVRIAETFIGLFCSVLVELVFQPTRASTLAKAQLTKTLGRLEECIWAVVSFHPGNKAANSERLNGLEFHVNGLRKLVDEAENEPNFWFFPFRSGYYPELFNSLSKMADLLLFTAHAIGHLQDQCNKWREINQTVESDLKQFKERLGSSLKCVEDSILMKSVLDQDVNSKIKNSNFPDDDDDDIEMGKSQSDNDQWSNEMERIVDCYLQHSKEIVDSCEMDQDVKAQMVLGLSCLGFCLSGLVKETKEIGKVIKGTLANAAMLV